MIADIEAAVATYLRDQGYRARVTHPEQTQREDAWVRVGLISAPSHPALPVDYFVSYLVQLDCYAGAEGGVPESRELAYNVRAALDGMPQADHDEAVVTAVKFAGFTAVPDQSMEPARERIILQARIWAHPNGDS